MHADRFFPTTRGKIVSELRRRGSASAAELAQAFGLSPNAVRQQLVVLERDGLVAETPVRRGPTKPTYEFSLTSEADKLFPQGYDKMLTAVLREVRAQFGTPAVEQIFDGLSRRAIERARGQVTATDPETKVAQLTEMLRKSGVVAEYSLIDGGFALHEHSVPTPMRRRKIRRFARSFITYWTKRLAANTRKPSRSRTAAGNAVSRFNPKEMVTVKMNFPKFQRLVEERTGFRTMENPPRAVSISATRAATCTTSF